MTADHRVVKNPQRHSRLDAPSNEGRDGIDLERRLRAAGLDTDDDDEIDLETFRFRFARRIWMSINDFPGCPEKQCQRMRGCMAPNGECANHRDDPPMTEEAWAASRLHFHRALNEVIDAHGGIDALELEAERQTEARRAAGAAEMPGNAHGRKGNKTAKPGGGVEDVYVNINRLRRAIHALCERDADDFALAQGRAAVVG